MATTKKSARAAKPAAAAAPVAKLLDWRTAYFALVASVSMLVMAFSLIQFLHDLILVIFPSMVEADMAKDAAQFTEGTNVETNPAAWTGYAGPRYAKMMEDLMTVVVMGTLFWLHGLRFFRNGVKK